MTVLGYQENGYSIKKKNDKKHYKDKKYYSRWHGMSCCFIA